ncbi:MAG: hypothetical protein ABR886_00670 [Dehalococcoidales bacterium]
MMPKKPEEKQNNEITPGEAAPEANETLEKELAEAKKKAEENLANCHAVLQHPARPR